MEYRSQQEWRGVQLISLDDWGFPIVNPRPFDEDHLPHPAERAVATCPRLALLLEEVASDAR